MFHALELPWGKVDDYKEKYSLKMMKGGISLYNGTLLPAELRSFASEDFSFARWIEDERNATVLPPEPSEQKFSLNDTQKQVSILIEKSYLEEKPGVFIGSSKGTGKKLSSLAGITQIARNSGYGSKNRGKLLIVCSKGQEAKWRNIIRSYPVSSSLLRILLINYTQLNKMLLAPPQARVSNKPSTKRKAVSKSGEPTVDWDYIIFDDSHQLNGYPKNRLALEAASVAQLNSQYSIKRTPFVIFNSDKPGSSPLDFALMSKIIAPSLGIEKEPTPIEWADTLKNAGFSITQGRYGPLWLPEPKKNATPREVMKNNHLRLKETKKIARAFKKSNECIVLPIEQIQKVLPSPLVMSNSVKESYKEFWKEFKTSVNKTRLDNDSLQEKINEFKGKLGYLKNDAIIEEINAYKDFGRVFFIQVASNHNADKLVEKLLSKKIMAQNITNAKGKILEDMLSSFLEGEITVLVYSGEIKDINSYGLYPRAGFDPLIYIADPQIEINIDKISSSFEWLGKKSLIYLCYFEKTLEEILVESLLKEEELTIDKIHKEFKLAAAKNARRNRMS